MFSVALFTKPWAHEVLSQDLVKSWSHKIETLPIILKSDRYLSSSDTEPVPHVKFQSDIKFLTTDIVTLRQKILR